MEGNKIALKVFRKMPGEEKGSYREYVLEQKPHMTVLEALRTIYGENDNSLAYHAYACYRLVCNLCTYTINGKPEFACRTLVEDGMVIGPPPNKRLLKDMVTDWYTTSEQELKELLKTEGSDG